MNKQGIKSPEEIALEWSGASRMEMVPMAMLQACLEAFAAGKARATETGPRADEYTAGL